MSPTTIGGSIVELKIALAESNGPLSTPPFYAIAMQGWTLVSFAGLKVNAELQVQCRTPRHPQPLCN